MTNSILFPIYDTSGAAWAAGSIRSGTGSSGVDSIFTMWTTPAVLSGLPGRKMLYSAQASEADDAIQACLDNGIDWLLMHIESPQDGLVITWQDALELQEEVFNKCVAAGIRMLYEPHAAWFYQHHVLFMQHCHEISWPIHVLQNTIYWPEVVRDDISIARSARPRMPFWVQISLTPPYDPTRNWQNVVQDMVDVYDLVEGIQLFYYQPNVINAEAVVEEFWRRTEISPGVQPASSIGLDNLYIAEVTEDSIDTYTAGSPSILAPVIEAKAEPSSSSAVQYPEEAAYDALQAEFETKITLRVTALPLETLAAISGRIYDAASGRMFDNQVVSPYFALLFRSLKTNGNYNYYSYLKGRFDMPKEEFSSQGDKVDLKVVEITYTAVPTIYQFNLWGEVYGSVKRVIGDEDAFNFDGSTWFDQVQMPVIATPDALALAASVPYDGAVDVDRDINETLIFNNPLVNANGIALYKISDGSKVAAAITLNATGKKVTINPDSSLENFTDYLLTYAAVDIYGQMLNGAVNFTTLNSNPELVLNPGFETAGTGGSDIFDVWDESYGGGPVEDETVLVHSGNHACKLSNGIDGIGAVAQDLAVTALSNYVFSFWTRGDGENDGTYSIADWSNGGWLFQDVHSTIVGETYTLITVNVSIPSECTMIKIVIASSLGTAYFDDISFKAA